MEVDFTERRARELLHEIATSVDLSFSTALSSMSVITQEDAKRVREMTTTDSYKANLELMDCVFNSKEPGKWKSFLDALETTGYEDIRQAFMSPSGGDNDEYRAHAHAVIRLFTPDLALCMTVDSIVDKLYSEDILSDVDKQNIYCERTNNGDYSANLMLLDKMTRRVKPRKWYSAFLQSLVESGNKHLAEKVEPEFFPIRDNNVDSKIIDSVNEQEEEDDMSVYEQTLCDDGDGEMDTNDLGVPPVPKRTYSLDTHIPLEVDNNTNFNIKPDVEKIIELDDDGPENECERSYDNSMESDDEETQSYKLRSYQNELAQDAIEGKNTIICSETGTGKTWVALEIIKRHFEDRNGPRKVVAFMACTCLLVEQQAQRIERHLSMCKLKTKSITGVKDDSKFLNLYIRQYDIICFTPQILVDNLDKKAVRSLSEFSLLILDECHHTRGDEPYSRLMRKYLVEKSNNEHGLPQIVGLTASIGVGKSSSEEEAVHYILSVMARLDVRILSTVEKNTDALRKHVNMPVEETIQLEKKDDDPCTNILLAAIEDTEDLLEEHALMQSDIIDLMTRGQLLERGSQAYNKWTVDLFRSAQLKVDDSGTFRDICTCAQYLNSYSSALEINKLLCANDVIKYLTKKRSPDGVHKDKHTEMEKTLYQKLIDVQKKLFKERKQTENPNVRTLSDTLKNMLDTKGEDSRALVFVKARATCTSLTEFLEQDLRSSGYKTSPLYGKENRCGNAGMTESVQTDILEKFRKGVFKVLVCTSVGNEGIDVPQCNIVLSYEYSGDEITKIQMKGRARTKDATSIIMASERVIDQDRKNAYKASMMYKALNKIKGLKKNFIEQEVRRFHVKEMSKHRFQEEIEANKKVNKTAEEHDLLCGKCGLFACSVSDVRQMKTNRVVVDKEFADRIERRDNRTPQTFDGIEKKFKMFCIGCGHDWGSIGIKKGIEFPILQIRNIKFKNKRTGEISVHEKWDDQPCRILEMRPEDIPRMLGDHH